MARLKYSPRKAEKQATCFLIITFMIFGALFLVSIAEFSIIIFGSRNFGSGKRDVLFDHFNAAWGHSVLTIKDSSLQVDLEHALSNLIMQNKTTQEEAIRMFRSEVFVRRIKSLILNAAINKIVPCNFNGSRVPTAKLRNQECQFSDLKSSVPAANIKNDINDTATDLFGSDHPYQRKRVNYNDEISNDTKPQEVTDAVPEILPVLLKQCVKDPIDLGKTNLSDPTIQPSQYQLLIDTHNIETHFLPLGNLMIK